jgi:hypothetical protein
VRVGLDGVHERGEQVGVKVPPVVLDATAHRHGDAGGVRQFGDQDPQAAQRQPPGPQVAEVDA